MLKQIWKQVNGWTASTTVINITNVCLWFQQYLYVSCVGHAVDISLLLSAEQDSTCRLFIVVPRGFRRNLEQNRRQQFEKGDDLSRSRIAAFDGAEVGIHDVDSR